MIHYSYIFLGFALSLPERSSSFVVPWSPSNFLHHQVSEQRSKQSSFSNPTTRVTPLFVVADAEDISKNRRKSNNNQNNGDSGYQGGDNDDRINNNSYNFNNEEDLDDAWIPTVSGGFLPNLSRRLRNIVSRSDQPNKNNANQIRKTQAQHDHLESSYLKPSPIIPPSSSDVVIPMPSPKEIVADPSITRRTKVIEVLSIEEYKKIVIDESEKIVVVRFHASWCRACKAVGPKFRQLLPQKFAKYDRVKFVEVPLTKENAFLHQGLGVPSLPFAHIYYPTIGLVEELKINQNRFSHFVNVLESYVQGFCDLEEYEKRSIDQSNDELTP